jgi:hypothetical protein
MALDILLKAGMRGIIYAGHLHITDAIQQNWLYRSADKMLLLTVRRPLFGVHVVDKVAK